MFNKLLTFIPLNRILLYLALLGFLPSLYLAYDYTKKRERLLHLEERVLEVRQQGAFKRQKQALNNLVKEHFANVDHFYIDHHLESFSLLNKEKAALQKIIENDAFTGSASVEERLAFLNSEENKLLFSEGSVVSGEGVQETLEVLLHPVEVDADDLKEILKRIEEKKAGQPQLIITDFKLNKRNTLSEVYELHLKLLKREFPSA